MMILRRLSPWLTECLLTVLRQGWELRQRILIPFPNHPDMSLIRLGAL